MAKLKHNVVANYLGQGWSAIMALAFVPLYIRYLGMEAYGLIGLFAVMQAWLTLLDMGITPTLNREMARFTAGKHAPQSIRDLLRSLEILCYSIAIVMALAMWMASGYLARDWLNAQTLPTPVVAQAISIMAFVMAVRFVDGVYRGSLYGLQKQVWYNITNALLSTFRWAGTVAVLAFISPTIEAFFVWQGLSSLLSMVVLGTAVHRMLPRAPAPARFSRQALSGVWKFASGMMGITFLSLLLTQVDKLLLSRLLELKTFGYYTLAASLAGMLYMIVGPVTTAIYPRMVELVTEADKNGLVLLYHKGAQLVTVLIAPAAILLCVFANGIVFMWTGSAIHAANTGSILSALAIGSFLNSSMWMPYQGQLAYGWTGFTLKTNLIGVVIMVPAIFWVTPRYGAVGAAWLWAGLNTAYVTIVMQFLHRKMLPDEKWRWYLHDMLSPITGALIIALLARLLQPAQYQDRLSWFVFLLVTGVLMQMASALLANQVRPRILAVLSSQSWFSSVRLLSNSARRRLTSKSGN